MFTRTVFDIVERRGDGQRWATLEESFSTVWGIPAGLLAFGGVRFMIAVKLP